MNIAVDQSPGCASTGFSRQRLTMGHMAKSIMPQAARAKICIQSICIPL